MKTLAALKAVAAAALKEAPCRTLVAAAAVAGVDIQAWKQGRFLCLRLRTLMSSTMMSYLNAS